MTFITTFIFCPVFFFFSPSLPEGLAEEEERGSCTVHGIVNRLGLPYSLPTYPPCLVWYTQKHRRWFRVSMDGWTAGRVVYHARISLDLLYRFFFVRVDRFKGAWTTERNPEAGLI